MRTGEVEDERSTGGGEEEEKRGLFSCVLMLLKDCLFFVICKPV